MPCQFGKQTAIPFNNSVSHSLSPFDLIHSDVWGPSPITTQGGSRYFVIFVDDFSRYTWIYLFKNCSELYHIYRDFTKMIETQFSKPIKVFRSDYAQEYKAHEFNSILHQFGIVPHSSCVGTSQQNGKVERKLRHILDVVCATTITISTPSQFLGKLLLLSFTPSIGVLLPLFRIKLLMICCLVILPPMTYLESLDVSVLFFFKIVKETNLSFFLVCVFFLGVELIKKVISVMIPLANVFVFLGIWSFGNTKCFTNYLLFLFPLFPLSILSLTFNLRSLPLLCLSTLTWSLSLPLLFLMFLLMHLMSFPHRSSTCPLILPQLWILPVLLTPMHFVVPIG